jgi:Cdc6-like AAA superfamily ATPase
VVCCTRVTVEPEIRVRKTVDDLTGEELQRLRAAFAAAQADSSYQQVAGIHGLPLPIYAQLHNTRTLPWHRAYLLRFERMLQRFDSGVVVPAWDWSAGQAIPAAFAAELADGGPNPLYSATIDPTALEQESGGSSATTVRDPGASGVQLPGADALGAVLALADYLDFSGQLESLSDLVHVWVGGHMGSVSVGAYDPIFWANLAMMDRVWWLWQHRHPDVTLPERLLNEELVPFELKVRDVLRVDSLAYDGTAGGTAPTDLRVLTGATNDLPASDDQLGFRYYARAFAQVIASPETKPPLTIGIFGSWGIGKSTLLDEIVSEIVRGQGETAPEDRPDPELREGSRFIHIVRFNAWDYSTEEPIWPALVRVIMDGIHRDIRWPRRTRVRHIFVRNLEHEWQRNAARIVVGLVLVAVAAAIALADIGVSGTGVALALLGLGAAGVTKVAVDSFGNPAAKWISSLFQESGYGRRVGYIEAIRDDLAFLVAQLQKQAKVTRVVLVVIDDLDRCEPEKAVEVLQAINRLLTTPSFIVCLGIDARVVSAAIQDHYGGALGRASGYEYLDKIVQIPFRIPEPDFDAISAFLKSQLPTARPAEPARAVAPASEDGATATAGTTEAPDGTTAVPGRYRVPAVGEATPAPLGQTVAFRADELQAFEEIATLLRPNARHIKRLINVYRLVRTVADYKFHEAGGREKEDARVVLDNPGATIRWLVLSAQWPYTARAIVAEWQAMQQSGTRPKATGDHPLAVLLERASKTLTSETQQQFDEDLQALRELVKGMRIGWDELGVIRNYTINFNPAVEEELRLDRLRHAAPARTPSRRKPTTRPKNDKSRADAGPSTK